MNAVASRPCELLRVLRGRGAVGARGVRRLGRAGGRLSRERLLRDGHGAELRLVDLLAAERVVDDAVGGDAALLDVSAAERRGCIAGPAERREQRDDRDDEGGGRTTDADGGTHENPPVLGGEPGARLFDAFSFRQPEPAVCSPGDARSVKCATQEDCDCGTGIRTPIPRTRTECLAVRRSRKDSPIRIEASPGRRPRFAAAYRRARCSCTWSSASRSSRSASPTSPAPAPSTRRSAGAAPRPTTTSCSSRPAGWSSRCGAARSSPPTAGSSTTRAAGAASRSRTTSARRRRSTR